jgi:hypothetical protein
MLLTPLLGVSVGGRGLEASEAAEAVTEGWAQIDHSPTAVAPFCQTWQDCRRVTEEKQHDHDYNVRMWIAYGWLSSGVKQQTHHPISCKPVPVGCKHSGRAAAQHCYIGCSALRDYL